MDRFAVGIALSVSLAGCSSENPGRLTDGRGAGFRYNIELPEPPRTREDDGAELTPTSGGPAVAPGSTLDVAGQCVAAINDYRAKVAAAPLARWTEAESCTAGQCLSDSNTKKPHGSFGSCTELGQNECPGWLGWTGNPKDVIRRCLTDMWAEGPGGGHYENMKASRFRKVACSVHVAPNGQVTAIQNFR